MKSIKLLAGAAVAAFMAPAAFAGPITFDFSSLSGPEGPVSSYSASVGSLTATITAWGYSNSSGITGTSYDVYLDSNSSQDGIGLYKGGGDADELDGYGADEGLMIQFSEVVSLDMIRFLDGDHDYHFASSDDFDLWADGIKVLNEHGIESHDSNGWVSTSNLIGSVFWLGADGTSDSFYLQGLNVATAAGVPEPGTLALLGLGLAGIGFSRRKKKA